MTSVGMVGIRRKEDRSGLVGWLVGWLVQGTCSGYVYGCGVWMLLLSIKSEEKGSISFFSFSH